MYLEIYPDIVFVLNFFMDLLLLVLVKAVNRKQCKVWRLVLAAAVGGLFTVFISLLPWLNYITNSQSGAGWIQGIQVGIKFLAILVMIPIAFGRMKWTDFLKQGISLSLITYFVGGLMNSLYYDTNLKLSLLDLGNTVMFSNISIAFVAMVMIGVLFLAAALLSLWRFYRHRDKEVYTVELSYEGRRIQTMGLFDTGNCLFDPLYHRPVIVVERNLLKELLSAEGLDEFENTKHYLDGTRSEEEMAVSLEGSEESKKLLLRLRMIPYSTIGNTQGMMFGIMLDHVLIHTGKECVCCNRVTAAISDNQLSPKEEYHVILHRELLV